MKFKKSVTLNEDAKSIVKDIVKSKEYCQIIDLMSKLLDKTAVDNDDYMFLKNFVIPKLQIQVLKDL